MPRKIELLSKDNIDLAFNFFANANKSNAEYFENYIRYSALGDMDSGMAVTHIFVEENEKTKERIMLGYVTLRNSSFVKDMDGEKIGYPSLEIYVLCVNKEFEGNKIGTHLVALAMQTALYISKKFSGIQYIVLCATEESKNFYMRKELGFACTEELLPRTADNIKCIPMYLRLKF